MSTTENDVSDVFIVHSSHTAVPNWIALRADISLGARNLAHVILIKAHSSLLPTRESLAELLGVDVRTIAGWLTELRAAGAMRTYRAGRRNFFIVNDSGLASIGDPTISDPTISDPTISDPTISDPTISDPQIPNQGMSRTRFLEQQEASNNLFFENPISDPAILPSGGGGGDHDSVKDSPPTTTPTAKKAQPCETRLGRFMAANGFGAAREFDRPELDSNHWIHFIRLQLESNVSKERIVHLLRLGAPLEWIAPVPVAPTATAPLDDAGEVPDMTPAVAMPIDQAMHRWNQRHGAKR
jgi:hypothetical protein